MAYTTKLVDGVAVALTAPEIAELEARDAAWAAQQAAPKAKSALEDLLDLLRAKNVISEPEAATLRDKVK